MKTILFVCVALLIIFAPSVQVHCQDDSLVGGLKTVDGNVSSVDVQNSQVTIKASETMTFSVPSGAKIVNADGVGIQLSDVNTGNYVTVDYSDDKSGLHIMKGMEVEYNR
jgi:hypothetical protein